MNSLSNIFKIIFHFLNFTVIFFYIFPGSIMGFFLYNNIKKQPKLINDFTSDIINISSNHFYTFFVLSLFGILSYYRKKHLNLVSIYLITISFILEIFHVFIPNRSFQYEDLFGNVLGTIFVIFIFKIWRKTT